MHLPVDSAYLDDVQVRTPQITAGPRMKIRMAVENEVRVEGQSVLFV